MEDENRPRVICGMCGQADGHWYTCTYLEDRRNDEVERERHLGRVLEPYAGPLGAGDLENILDELRTVGVVPPVTPVRILPEDGEPQRYRS